MGPTGPVGPTGATGATGATGPAGPAGSGIVSTDTSGSTTYLTTTCLNYANAAVTITVPGPGTVVVQANAYMIADHTTGTRNYMILGIGTTMTDCGSVYDESRWDIPAAWPTASGISQTVPVARSFTIAAAGTYTYYLNGYMSSGYVASTDRFWFANLIATFHQN
jgi:hypothetical protein